MDDLEFNDSRDLTGAYLVLALEARKQLIELLIRQEREIKRVYRSAIKDVNKSLSDKESAYRYIENIDTHLKNAARNIFDKLSSRFDDGIIISVESGMHQSKQATLSLLKKSDIDWKPIERSLFRSSKKAVEDMHKRTIKGLNLSDRIWSSSKKAMDSVGEIVKQSIRLGMHPTEVAKALESYVQKGSRTLAVNYPEMFERISVPMDMNYESLRLARTEMATAFGNGTIESAKVNPANKGIQWRISNAGVTCDICLDHSKLNTGLGAGVYPVDELPDYPAHPNCLCTLVEINEDTDDFVDKLIKWNKNPMSQPGIEKWYQDVYKVGEVA